MQLRDAEGVVGQIGRVPRLHGGEHLGGKVAELLGVGRRDIEFDAPLLRKIFDRGAEQILNLFKVFGPVDDGELARCSRGQGQILLREDKNVAPGHNQDGTRTRGGSKEFSATDGLGHNVSFPKKDVKGFGLGLRA